ncbi:MAG TPA: NapC/NirT family cytochrome c [Ignavibacteriaceae bacterium]|nr:NapC/NirT family cytochrome c [Ignavibacteriaceae bacterium]
MKKIFPSVVYNPITMVGAAIASISFGLILFVFILEIFSSIGDNPYIGILAFIILPAILIFGLLLIAYGIIRERKRVASGKSREGKLPVIDLNDPQKRSAFAFFSIGTLILLLFSAFGSYKAYEYTETDEFCGTVCHKVMEPEYTAYLGSPHSRVGCVGCHIGSGTDWYVKSKLSGAYQFYSVLFKKYSQPIPTPVRELRPADGTCEQCHSPEHFFSQKKTEYTYYISDEKNTRSNLGMLIKIGGGNSVFGAATGIHWHTSSDQEIYYMHSDERRQEIPWVKLVTKDGKEIIYRDKSVKFDEASFPKENLRLMDCIDCHNRPSHIFHQPDKMVNVYMDQNKIDPELPYIKSISVKALETPYTEKSIALDSIETIINSFYRSTYRDIYEKKKDKIASAIQEVQSIYSRNYFPYMNANWKSFPDNISHVYTPGCFRCHAGNHVSEDGLKISHDCNSCHLIISQTNSDGIRKVDLDGLQFEHPVDIGSDVRDLLCTDCHAN